MAAMMIRTLSYVRSALIRSSPLILLISLSMCLGFGFLWTVSAQIQWTPEAQVNWDDVYDDWMPMVAAGPDGRVWVVWQQSGPRGWKALASVWEGSSWAYPQALCPDDGIQDSLTDIAVGPNNSPWIVLVRLTDDPPYLHYTRWNGIGWDQVQPMFPDLAEERVPLAPRIAVDSSGTPWVIWSSYVTEDYDSDLFYSRWNETTWASPEPVCANSGPGSVNARDIAAGIEGDVWVVWGRHLAPPQHDWAQYMLTSHWQGNEWAEPDTVPEGDSGNGIAIGSSGEVWVVTDREGDIWAYQRSDGEWLPGEKVSSPDSTASGANASDGWPSIALQADGTPRVVWTGSNWGGGDFDYEIYTATKTSGCWLPEEQISVTDAFDDGYANSCVSETGEAWAVWQGWDGTDYEILYSWANGACVGSLSSSRSASAVVCPYPNPAEERVSFNLPEEGSILERLRIFDISGRLVQELPGGASDFSLFSPTKPLVWNCTDLQGEKVLQGCYVYRAEAEGRAYEGVVILVR
jgi:hypothetical protein